MKPQHLTAEEIWRKYDAGERRLSAPLSQRMLDLAKLRPGMKVLDIATGRGEPAIPAARRVGPEGSVLGVDISATMLQMARDRAECEGLENLDLRVMDAQSLPGVPLAAFDAVLARWGLMYFESPIAALSAARRAMVPGGVLVAAVWAEPERVPYFTLPRRILGKYTSVPLIDFDAPGTFRYCDPARLQHDFGAAGFVIEHIEEQEVAVMEAQSSADLIAWFRAFGLARLMSDLPDKTQKDWETDITKETEPLWRNGKILLGGVTRIVVASFAD